MDVATDVADASSAPPTVSEDGKNLRWYYEVLLVLGFYVVYSMVRNLFGSAAVDPEVAYNNAIRVIDIEKAIGLFQEERIQGWFATNEAFFQFWNIFYGTLHFAVTIFCFVYLYRKVPAHYARWRTTFAATTALALVGFSTFPLMPPRLLNIGGEFGGARFGGDRFTFIDTVAEYGGLWSFDSGTMQSISNQYAAMPSLHLAWAAWCAVTVAPHLGNRIARFSLWAYPVLTLFAIVITANHYWIDAVGGLVALGAGYALAVLLHRILTNPTVA